MEQLEVLSDDVKYLMLCQQNGEPDEVNHKFSTCANKDELLALEKALDDEKVFRSTVSFKI